MERGMYDVIRGVVVGAALLLTISLNSADVSVSPQEKEQIVTPEVPHQEVAWQEFHSAEGHCHMQFPKYPDHLSEKMHLPKEGFDLKYDAYISAADQKTVFLLLIAQYPDFVDETYAKMSLEGFLNGVLTHNPNNQLIFADLSLVDGHEALDFFIRTGGVYFKGRALMVKNSLYLMAMECEVQNFDETHYKRFIDSFSLSE